MKISPFPEEWISSIWHRTLKCFYAMIRKNGSNTKPEKRIYFAELYLSNAKSLSCTEPCWVSSYLPWEVLTFRKCFLDRSLEELIKTIFKLLTIQSGWSLNSKNKNKVFWLEGFSPCFSSWVGITEKVWQPSPAMGRKSTDVLNTAKQSNQINQHQ